MLTYYRYKVDKGMMDLSEVPEPYQRMLREEYSKKVADGVITEAEYQQITGKEYVAPTA
jgi:hypothetical protein